MRAHSPFLHLSRRVIPHLTPLRPSLTCRYRPQAFPRLDPVESWSLTLLPTSLCRPSQKDPPKTQVDVRALSDMGCETILTHSGPYEPDRVVLAPFQTFNATLAHCTTGAWMAMMWRQAQRKTNELPALLRRPGEESLTGVRWVASLHQCRCTGHPTTSARCPPPRPECHAYR